MKIGVLALRSGLPDKTPRYDEDLGLLPAIGRSEGGYRLFAEQSLRRLDFIRRLKTLGLSLEEIQGCLAVHDAGELPCGDIQIQLGRQRMSEFVFGIGAPGVGALGKSIWRDQANEIRAMGLWRKAWYPQAPVYPVALATGGDPNSLSGLSRMSQAQIAGMRMQGDALAKSTNPTILRFARQVIVAQRVEILELRRMLAACSLFGSGGLLARCHRLPRLVIDERAAPLCHDSLGRTPSSRRSRADRAMAPKPLSDRDCPALWSRRRLLALAAAGLGIGTLAGPLGGALASSRSGTDVDGLSLPFDPTAGLRAFNHGTVIQENGVPIRVFEVHARSLTVPLRRATRFKAWTLDGTIPGPNLRARAGERIRVIFHNEDSTSHSLHFHGIHPAAMDGIQPVLYNKTKIYDFEAGAAGLYPYHCHVAPVTRHVGKGLFGLLIVDPLQPRAAADELVLVMGGYDLHNTGHNDLYAFNGIPHHFMQHPIEIRQHQLVRLYLLNMVELEAPLTFHIHANSFEILRQGPAGEFRERSDVVTLGVAERHILEFSYPFAGRYMFHPHQDQIAEKGCMGLFDVLPV